MQFTASVQKTNANQQRLKPNPNIPKPEKSKEKILSANFKDEDL